MLIIEGIDGVGKTTLVEYLQSYGMKNIILIMIQKAWTYYQNI